MLDRLFTCCLETVMQWSEEEEEHLKRVLRLGGIVRGKRIEYEKLFYIWRYKDWEYVAYGSFHSRPRHRIWDNTVRFVGTEHVVYVSTEGRHQFLDGLCQNPMGYNHIVGETIRVREDRNTASYLAVRDSTFHYVANNSEGKGYRLILQYTLCWFNGQPFYLAVANTNRSRVGRAVYGHEEIAKFDWWKPESFCIKDDLPWFEAGRNTAGGGRGMSHIIHGTSVRPPFTAVTDEGPAVAATATI